MSGVLAPDEECHVDVDVERRAVVRARKGSVLSVPSLFALNYH